jgi:hypothetical protein
MQQWLHGSLLPVPVPANRRFYSFVVVDSDFQMRTSGRGLESVLTDKRQNDGRLAGAMSSCTCCTRSAFRVPTSIKDGFEAGSSLDFKTQLRAFSKDERGQEPVIHRTPASQVRCEKKGMTEKEISLCARSEVLEI